uniref:Uncharacterized protein n=1 Tax=Arundo donax TaxID=35708 RepID=A0A0A8YEB1_ARUDO
MWVSTARGRRTMTATGHGKLIVASSPLPISCPQLLLLRSLSPNDLTVHFPILPLISISD